MEQGFSAIGWPALSLAAFLLMLWLLILSAGRLARAVPPFVREQEEPPPRFWQLLGWLGHAVAWWVRPLISPASRLRLQAALRRAGLAFSLTPEQFVAGQLLGGVLAVLVLLLAWLPQGLPSWMAGLLAFMLGACMPLSWLRDRTARRIRQLNRELPFFLDVITLAIEAGSNMSGALQHAVEKGPNGPMAEELGRVLRDMRAGRTRAESLRAMGERVRIPAVSNWIAAVLTAEKQGTSLGPILRAQSDQRRHERFMQAEAMALKAPVKMLFPLMTCIFPCTFIIVFFPIVMQIIQEGMF